jgi:hypothetical protein
MVSSAIASTRKAADFLEILSNSAPFASQWLGARTEQRGLFIFATGAANLLKKTWQNQEAYQILLLPALLVKL